MLDKNKYETPEIEFFDFKMTDIIVTSTPVVNQNITPTSSDYEGDIIKYNFHSP